MIRKILIVLALAVGVAAYSAPALADSIQLSCPACGTGSTSLLSSSPGAPISFSFVDVANQTLTGNAFVVILVPTGSVGGAPTLTGGTLVSTLAFTSGDLGTLLGQNLTGYNLSTFQSASGQVSINATGYTVYEFSVGNNVTLGPGGAGITGLVANGVAAGSVIVGFLDPPGTTYETPLSESITAVPESASLTLLALGLLTVAAAAVGWRRFLSN